MFDILISPQLSTAKAGSRDLYQLIDQDVPGCTDIARKCSAPAQHYGLAEGASVCEFWELQSDRVYALKRDAKGVLIVAEGQDAGGGNKGGQRLWRMRRFWGVKEVEFHKSRLQVCLSKYRLVNREK